MASVVVGFLTSARSATAASVAHAGTAQSSSPTAHLLRRIAVLCHCGPNEAAQPIRATRIALVRPGLQQLAYPIYAWAARQRATSTAALRHSSYSTDAGNQLERSTAAARDSSREVQARET